MKGAGTEKTPGACTEDRHDTQHQHTPHLRQHWREQESMERCQKSPHKQRQSAGKRFKQNVSMHCDQ